MNIHRNKKNKENLIKQENSTLFPYCRGKGIDVGCGGYKIHPRAIGVDITPKGKKGKWGRQKGVISQADVQSSGDNLSMFQDNELDYVVSSHNLEHYQNPMKTLKEWRRVLKPGGVIGVIIPDENKVRTMEIDPTHKYAFTQISFKELIQRIGGLKIIKLEECLKDRSFICVMKKSNK